jgi:hypothetical protein
MSKDVAADGCWKLCRVDGKGVWYFRNLCLLTKCIELTHEGRDITYDPIDKDASDSPTDNDCNVFISGDLEYRILEACDAYVQRAEVLH